MFFFSVVASFQSVGEVYSTFGSQCDSLFSTL